MNIQPRVKFSATISSIGNIVVGTATPSYLTPSGGSYWYLLEKATDWEIGYVDDTLAGKKRVPNLNSGSDFADDESGLTCTLVEPQYSVVAVTPSSSGFATAPYVNDNAYDSVASGSGVSVSSESSVAAGARALIQGSSPKSVVVGFESEAQGELSTAVGAQATTVSGGVALGALSQTTNPGEVSIGSAYSPHISFLAVKAPVGVDAGGTFEFLALTGALSGGSQVTGALASLLPARANAAYLTFHHRIQGTIVCKASSAADNRVYDLDILVMNGTVMYTTATSKYSGANDVTYTLSLNGSGHLQIVSPAITGLKVTGLLQITKILVS